MWVFLWWTQNLAERNINQNFLVEMLLMCPGLEQLLWFLYDSFWIAENISLCKIKAVSLGVQRQGLCVVLYLDKEHAKSPEKAAESFLNTKGL